MKLINNEKTLSIVIQLLVLSLLILFLLWGVNNAAVNLEKAGIGSGFGFLQETAGFDVAQKLIPFDRNSTFLDAFYVGLLNTLLVSAIAIVLSTFMGFFIGVARLSDNFFLRNAASIYIGSIRNFPLLLQILFWYIAILSPLPSPKKAYNLGADWFLSNRGIIGPAPIFNESANYLGWIFVAAIIISVAFFFWAKKYHIKTGIYLPRFSIAFVFIIITLVLSLFLLNNPVSWSVPELKGFNFKGGFTILPELIALVVALSCYAAAFIAENVRAGILSVSKGQHEAAKSLSLSNAKSMRLVIIPQALRIVIPPLTSQHLTTVKNSSLAVVIGYPDLIHVFAGTTLNQTGQAVEIVSIVMIVYLVISLLISYGMNVYNNKMQIKER